VLENRRTILFLRFEAKENFDCVCVCVCNDVKAV